MKRAITSAILEGLHKKIVLLMGPRQVGKTTLSKQLLTSYSYYNYDIKKDLNVFKRAEWDRSTDLVIFDELHKMKNWKLWLKGIYDEGLNQKILVTGSSRLDVMKKVGDSLAGRFFSFRLHPMDLKEAKGLRTTEENYKTLLAVGGFPEPFLEGSDSFYGRWSKSHLDTIIRQDLLSLENVRDIDGLESLIEILSTRVGSTISVNSIAEDLHRDDKTISRWLRILENLYIVFKVDPYSKNIARALKKSAKYFFYDLGRVEGDESRKFENLAALSLKKEIERQEDEEGIPGSLHFAQNREHKEIDFIVIQKKKAIRLIETKLSDDTVSKNFSIFSKFFPEAERIQLVRNLSRSFQTRDGIRVEPALSFLENLKL